MTQELLLFTTTPQMQAKYVSNSCIVKLYATRLLAEVALL